MFFVSFRYVFYDMIVVNYIWVNDGFLCKVDNFNDVEVSLGENDFVIGI